jgi:hypothetical protein
LLRQALPYLGGKLPAVLAGKASPRDNAERLGLAGLCRQPYQQRYAAAARLFAEAFAGEPGLTERARYDAACGAALAGCGRGKDAPAGHAERAGLRRQALDWLRADLAGWARQAGGAGARTPEAVRQRLRHWQRDPDLAGVRDPAALGQLAEAERQAWRRLWDDVAALVTRSGGPP